MQPHERARADLAAPASGSGKTTVTLALLRALRRRGVAVGAFKVGPDYLDPMFHARACGRPCVNLDSWAMRIETLAGLADDLTRDVDLVLGEGVMGLFDGAADGQGSTADLASLFDLPVILVVDARGMAASAAALVEGFTRHRDDVEIAGVIFNRVASDEHAALLRRACDDRFAQPVLACLPSDPRLELPARHLGLVQAAEVPELEAFLERAAEIVAEHSISTGWSGSPGRSGSACTGRRRGRCGRSASGSRSRATSRSPSPIPAMLDGWRVAGAEILPFSPLADEPPDPGADAVYLPGGYPELHAGRLAANAHSSTACARRRTRGAFVYGECGGYMALGRRLIDRAGRRPRHGRPAAGRDQLRRAAAAARLPAPEAARGIARSARPARPTAATSSTTRA